MRTELRIIAGRLRGRKLHCTVSKAMRPAAQMVRAALFSILGDAVPGRDFFDLFAGTGAVGLEALSRGARQVLLIERDFHTAAAIDVHVRAFGVAGQARVLRADVYRWVERWRPESEPVNVFLGPPYPDFQDRYDELLVVIGDLQAKLPAGSVLIVQAEDVFDTALLPGRADWDERTYGRNVLLIWVKP